MSARPPSSSAPDGAAPERGDGRRLLLVSCEFDATASPQGMRWVMLGDALAALGWRIDVVTFSPARADERPRDGLQVHRVSPGPYQAALARLRSRRHPPQPAIAAAVDAPAAGHTTAAAPRAAPAPVALNWKGRLEARLRAVSSLLLYPDLRREGLPSLRRRAAQLIAANDYAAAVLSHEPPLALELGAQLAAASIPVIADLGDPVLAGYTPPRWRKRALRLEADTCARARRIVVTSAATEDLLRTRHRVAPDKFETITQGYRPPTSVPATPADDDPQAPLRLVYTGRFYRFRDPRPMFDAVCAVDGLTLVVAAPQLPDWLDPAALAGPRFDVRGGLDHAAAVALQASADVLLVIGNDDPTQIPGKLFEYFGQDRPVLYVTGHADDAGARLVERLGRGLVVAPRRDTLEAALTGLVADKRAGALQRRFDLSRGAVAAYAWPALAQRYSALIGRTVSHA